MKIKTVALTNFRNYRKQIVTLGQGLNFIIGSNGEGKTNFLEALYVLSLVKSYKAADRDLILNGNGPSRIVATLETSTKTIELAVAFSETGKAASFNRQAVDRLSDYIGIMNVVLFTPEDMTLVKGGPADRRYFIDVVLGQVDKDYLYDLTQFKHALKQRNELLKQMQDKKINDLVVLEVITEQMADYGSKVIIKRKAFIEQLSKNASEMYRYLTSKDDTMVVKYAPSITNDYRQELKAKIATDLSSGTTNYGPHRDDIEWVLAGQTAKFYASQGEQRLIVLSVCMALCNYYAEIKSDRPIFLLDDVFSELDAEKQNRLIQYLLKSESQAIITATSLIEIADIYKQQAKIYHVFKGSIREEQQHGQS
ncbi:MAG: DNA replication/repair protein RecF [Candidatus Izemoplasmatales bacterium]|jgi:DNA replication and repair protein RecF|nr:DNA replication/repair protein RecF [Candidatus Izemoplasmatales bacterium]MDD3865490.1 DNA replication/repair protein RecF [Candidatus Izemoplasmatales bacterium]